MSEENLDSQTPPASEFDCDCDTVTQNMREIMNGEMDLLTAQHFHEHLRHCPNCHEESLRVERYITLLRQSCRCEAPAELRERIMIEIRKIG
ncbi:zf-HC2 domain-containing protein [uncultured Mobiluncus sp.]|uniref:zf-HC2 domain-containing protein n=1 Tax=uncultured Mobiluncus sp. TaxID=293425 RepID=UPI0025EC3AF2|nr:zf-HC2 domain-containing protein [uncultured Mobiluncus sp.]